MHIRQVELFIGWLAITLLVVPGCDLLSQQRSTASTPEASEPPSLTSNALTLPEIDALPLTGTRDTVFLAGQPLLNEAGLEVSSGLARISENRMELISRQGDTSSLEWVVYGLQGLDPLQQPESLQLTFEQTSGSIQVGISDFKNNLWNWEYISTPGVHNLQLADAQTVSSKGACYLALAVSNGASVVFSGGMLLGAQVAVEPEQPLADEGLPSQPDRDTTEPANTTVDEPGRLPNSASPQQLPSEGTGVTESDTTDSMESEPQQFRPRAAVDESPAVVGTNKTLVMPLEFPALHPYELPAQYLRLEGVINPIIPAEDISGWPLSSGMARFGQQRIHLTSVNAVADSVEWIVYGGSGYSPQTPPAQLSLSFDRIDGGVWIGLPNYTADRFDWQLVESAGPHTINLESRSIVRQDGEVYFALGVCGGNYAEFTGGLLEEGTGVDLLGVYLSHGYWEADKIESIFTELESLGVNFVVDYALRWPTDAEWQDEFNAYLLSAQRHGIGLAYCIFPALAGATPDSADAQFEKAMDEVYLLRSNPAIRAWYVHDEVLPMLAGAGGTAHYSLSLKQMQDLYVEIHDADPGRPQINTWTQIPDRKLFNEMYSGEYLPYGREMWMDRDTAFEQTMQGMVRTTCDWVFVDDYPVGAPWTEPGSNPASEVKATVSRIAALRSTSQPLYFVFQSFAHAQYGRGTADEAVFPSAGQMEEMLFAARLQGAQGALAYSWFDLTRTDLPGREVPGRLECLADVRSVLSQLSATGWPVPELPEPAAGSTAAE